MSLFKKIYPTILIIIVILFGVVLLTPNAILAADTVELQNPIGVDDPNVLIGQVINGVLGIVGSLALVMFIYGGLLWMLSGGNAETVRKGKGTLVWATVGLIVVFTAYAAVRFIFVNVFNANPNPDGSATSAEDALNRGTGSH